MNAKETDGVGLVEIECDLAAGSCTKDTVLGRILGCTENYVEVRALDTKFQLGG